MKTKRNKVDTQSILLNLKRETLAEIDSQIKYPMNRTTWIITAILEKLKREQETT